MSEVTDGRHPLLIKCDEALATVKSRYGGIVKEDIFDEVAIMVDTLGEATTLILEFVDQGWGTFFNSSKDYVYTRPFFGEYGVRYFFLQPKNRQYRIEIMVMGTGLSHAHIAAMTSTTKDGYGTVMHVSYKTPLQVLTNENWRILPPDAAQDEEEARLEDLGMMPVQRCISDYGRFSYWVSEGFHEFYLKPRVNIRDHS